jgi:hypothetical protein
MRKLVFFIDRIERSSYPVTETGYALVHRAWLRARTGGADVFIVYPEATALRRGSSWSIEAQRIIDFSVSPFHQYRSQRDSYRAGAHTGSLACHVASEPELVSLADAAALIWRQETGTRDDQLALLSMLSELEAHTIVYQSPRLALDPQFGSKVLPGMIDARCTPRSFYTHACRTGDKLGEALAFITCELGDPTTALVKPLNTNNGVGIAVLGRDPRGGPQRRAADDRALLTRLLAEHGELVVQEYIPSIRAPRELDVPLGEVPLDRRDFGEVRFLLIDGKLPRTPDGRACVFARRVPIAGSLVADSGISHPTTLSARERAFVEQVGRHYLRWGIYFGGGDLIRTPDPARPFVFTDAARSVCGHAVITGALNGEPYIIIDQLLDSLEAHIAGRRHEQAPARLHHAR